MRNTCKYSILICIIGLCILSCQSTTELQDEIPQEEVVIHFDQDINYTQGQWVAREFASEWYGFRYRPTQGLIITSENTLKEINAIQSMNFDGPNAELEDYTKMQIVYEVMVRTGDGETTLEILSEKIFAEDLTVEQYIEILKMELAVTHGRDVTFTETSPRLLGNSYYLDLSATINIEGKTVYQTILLSRKGDRFATVLIHCTSPEQIDELLSGFSRY